MSVQHVPLKTLKPNPNNPRIIKDDRFHKLVQSIRDFPEMLEARPIVVNEDQVIIGGNMRYRACKELGLKTVPVIQFSDWSAAKQREFVIKDNVNAGTFSFTAFFDNGDEWDVHELKDWGLEFPFMPNTDPSTATDSVTDTDVERAGEKLVAQFNDRKALREVTCPHCGEDFHVDQ